MKTDIIRKASIEELCAHRARALETFAQAHAFAGAANGAVKAMNLTGASIVRAQVSLAHSQRGHETKAEEYRAELDRALWAHMLTALRMERFMSARQRTAFRDQLQKDPPPFELETVYATACGWAASAGDTFEQSVLDVFEKLPSGFKSNDGLLSERAIFEYAVSHYGRSYSWTYSSYSTAKRDLLDDLERILCILDQKPHELRAVELVLEAFRDPARNTWTGEYFTLKWFKKGTLHIHFRRADLVRKMNDIIARRGDRLAA